MNQEHDWNMNLAHLQLISSIMEKKADAAMSNDLYTWYSCNWEIVTNISFILQKSDDETDELEKLKTLLNKIRLELSPKKNSAVVGQQRESALASRFSKAAEMLRELDLYIIQLMDKYGIIAIIKRKKTVEEVLDDDYQSL